MEYINLVNTYITIFRSLKALICIFTVKNILRFVFTYKDAKEPADMCPMMAIWYSAAA